MKRLVWFSLITFLALVASVNAAPIAAACAPTADVTTIGSAGCSFDGLVFSNFAVNSIPAGMTVGLAGITMSGSNVLLDFAIGGFFFSQPTVPDLRITYQVTGGTYGVDASLTNASPQVGMMETVCDSAGLRATGGACAGSVVASLGPVTSANSPMAVTFATPQSDIWIVKDITVPSNYTGSVFISEFVNSHAVPEPTTFALLGGGLILFAFARRKKA